MEKLYYDMTTGYVCDREPHMYSSDKKTYIEVDNDTYMATFACEYGYIWVVRDGCAVLEEDSVIRNSEEYKAMTKNNEICNLRQYLLDTDYVVTKLNELRLEDEEEYQKALEKYKDVLIKRKECRASINELEENTK